MTATTRVGHASTLGIDATRGDRALGIDMWYPTGALDGVAASYELLPGISLPSTTSIESAPPAEAQHPLVVWSHGRTGLRQNYSQLCEGLAARGFVVVAPDHPGDTLIDWLTGRNVDDTTNEIQRLGDVSFAIDLVTSGEGMPVALDRAIDQGRIYVAGHSYGGLTALISATGAHGIAGDSRVRAIAGAQAYTRTLPADLPQQLTVPALLLVGIGDVTTPPSTDADPIWSTMSALDPRHQRVDLPHGGHQACSDFSLYMELVPSMPDIPQMVLDYLESIAAESPEGFRDTWRDTLATQIEALAAFFSRN